MPHLAQLIALLGRATKDRTQLVLENIALRQQLAVYKRSVARPNINDRDRAFWLTVMRLLREWREALVFVHPETVIRWHRKGFAYYWRRKSRSKPGRPPIAMNVILLIRRMSQENVTWGAPRIVDELALLGHVVAESTVAKYMVRRRRPQPSQSWKTFLRNHMAETVACDFFVVPTVTFQRLYCFVVMSLDRRRILHVNVTRNPTAQWTAQQVVEALPGHGWMPRFLQRDRDGIYGWAFRRRVKAMGITELISAPRSPWQNAFVERLIGTIRRECTDHIIAMGERHLRRTLLEYAEYYNASPAPGIERFGRRLLVVAVREVRVARSPRVAGVEVEAAQAREQGIARIPSGDVADEQLDHRRPCARPLGVVPADLGGGADEVAVVEVVVVELWVAAVGSAAPDERAPARVVVEEGRGLALRGGEPVPVTRRTLDDERPGGWVPE